jgi:hypothetical protein
MFASKGTLRYFGHDKLILQIDKGLVDYYFSLIPKYYPKQRQKFFAKITVVRTNVERPDPKHWRKYEGERVTFTYDPYIYLDNDYWLLKAYSHRLCEIRRQLGLPSYRYPYQFFHITIANQKPLDN